MKMTTSRFSSKFVGGFFFVSVVTLAACTTLDRLGGKPESFSSRAPSSLSDPSLQHDTFLRWLDRKEGFWLRDKKELLSTGAQHLKWTDLHHVPKPQPDEVRMPRHGSADMIAQTTQAYFNLFGRNQLKSFLWTGIETGNNLTMDLSYRWDSLEDAGLYDRENRRKLVRTLKENGLWNVRLGMPNHLIKRNADGTWDEKGWKIVDEMLNDFVYPCGEGKTTGLDCEGLRISLDMHHFGLEDHFRTPQDKSKPVDHEKSYYLNDAWPAYFADFSLEAFRRFRKKIKAITIINEPDTTAQFNAGFWHGAFPGFNDQSTQYTIERAINIGKAAVLARIAIEKEMAQLPNQERLVYVHSEAAQSKPDDPVFVKFARFLTSDLILGHPWVLSPQIPVLGKRDPQTGMVRIDPATGKPERPSKGVDFQKLDAKWKGADAKTLKGLSSLDWVIHRLVFSSRKLSPKNEPYTPELKYDRIVERLNEVRDLHLQLRRETGLTMMSYTVLGIDYYMPNESFAAEIQANVKKGDKEKAAAQKADQTDKKDEAVAQEKPEEPVKRMRHEPQYYAEDIRAGIRRGLFPVMVDYWQRYPLPVMIAETGTAFFHYGDLWYQQMLLDSGALARSGVPFLAMTLYPTLDNWGWDEGKAMSRPKKESKKPVPSGVIWLHTKHMGPTDKFPDAQDWDAKRGLKSFVQELRTVFPE